MNVFEKMNGEIEFWYDRSYPINGYNNGEVSVSPFKGKIKCLAFWTRKVLFKGLSRVAPLNKNV